MTAHTSTTLHCEGIAQTRLQHFMVSLWLHFFRQQTASADTPWKECDRRRRRHFHAAQLDEVQQFTHYITSHGPVSQHAQLAAVVNSRLEHCQPLASRSGQPCHPPTEAIPH